MSEEPVQNGRLGKSKQSKELIKRMPKKPHPISEEDVKTLMKIAAKSKELRKNMNMSYEEFALSNGINRNTYFRFEQSSAKPNNYTVSLLLQVIRGLKMTPAQFFKDIK